MNQTLRYLEHKLTTELPETIANTEQVYNRMTLNYFGQLALWDGPKAEVIPIRDEGDAA